MDIFEYAIQMEKDGEDYYCQLAQQAANEGLKTILAMLADEEVKHRNIIEKMTKEIPDVRRFDVLGTNHYGIVFQPHKDRDKAIRDFLKES